jgi:hypothetical protein
MLHYLAKPVFLPLWNLYEVKPVPGIQCTIIEPLRGFSFAALMDTKIRPHIGNTHCVICCQSSPSSYTSKRYTYTSLATRNA